MKQFILLLFFLSSFGASSQTITVDALRREYQQVHSDSALCAKLYSRVNKTNNSDIITNAYRGAISISMANHSKEKKEKIKLFNTGKKILEESIASDSSNIELRFIRFTIQTNCPKVLRYNKEIVNDKNFILKNFSSITNGAIKKMIVSFFNQSNSVTDSEKKNLNK
jgi:hypothetical protein